MTFFTVSWETSVASSFGGASQELIDFISRRRARFSRFVLDTFCGRNGIFSRITTSGPYRSKKNLNWIWNDAKMRGEGGEEVWKWFHSFFFFRSADWFLFLVIGPTTFTVKLSKFDPKTSFFHFYFSGETHTQHHDHPEDTVGCAPNRWGKLETKNMIALNCARFNCQFCDRKIFFACPSPFMFWSLL